MKREGGLVSGCVFVADSWGEDLPGEENDFILLGLWRRQGQKTIQLTARIILRLYSGYVWYYLLILTSYIACSEHKCTHATVDLRALSN